jgi:hypothetical protein
MMQAGAAVCWPVVHSKRLASEGKSEQTSVFFAFL